ncbi:hypothetical protein PO002_33870 [Cupriavidus necator]
MKKWLGRTALALLILGVVLAAGGYAYLQHPRESLINEVFV